MNDSDVQATKYGVVIKAQRDVLWPHITNLIHVESGDRILDVGCGRGAYAKWFYDKGAYVIGIDSSKRQIEIAKRKNSGPYYINACCEELPLYDGECDFVLANMLTCKISSGRGIQLFFEQCHRVVYTHDSKLYPDGQLIVSAVTPEFHRTCDTAFLRQKYPARAGKPMDSCRIKVFLSAIDGTWVGPIENFHWGEEFLMVAAARAGWECVMRQELVPIGTEKIHLLKPYVLYGFGKMEGATI